MFNINKINIQLMSSDKPITIKYIKYLGKNRTSENFEKLLSLYNENLPVILKREIVSSIGRHKTNDRIYNFIESNVFKPNQMDIIYQMYRTILYKSSFDERFMDLRVKVKNYYNNEVINKMDLFYNYKHYYNIKNKKSSSKMINIKSPLLLEGDNNITLKSLKSESVQLIFTSPPYYNAREYSVYKSYQEYLDAMKKTLRSCHRVLETGRYIVINVSPIISQRPGREFESTRYPIQYDFHTLLTDVGFEFVDEIIWVKPLPSVPYRIGNFMKLLKPLMYKPQSITETIMVYKKPSPFLIEKIVSKYSQSEVVDEQDQIDESNVWHIAPSNHKDHPAVFPETLCKKILKYYSFKNDIVLDPYAGSGTLGKIALEMNRRVILCEQNADYIELIKKRLNIHHE